MTKKEKMKREEKKELKKKKKETEKERQGEIDWYLKCELLMAAKSDLHKELCIKYNKLE